MQLAHLFQMKATVAAPIEIGPMPIGTRRIFNATGGRFEGERLRGDVLPGGQVRLTAQNKRRSEMIGIIDWRMAQCAARDVEFRFNSWAEADDVMGLNPDVVIIATGGLTSRHFPAMMLIGPWIP